MQGSASSATRLSMGETPDLQTIDRFQTDIQAKGIFKPGEPIQLSVSVQARLSTQDASIQLFLPEIQALNKKGAGQPAVIPIGEPLPPQASWSQSLAQRQTFTRQQTITVKEPGYYHVLVSVQDKDAKNLTKSGMPVINSA